MRTANQAKLPYQITPRDNAAGSALAQSWRRVFKNTRDEKQRTDPERSQLRNFFIKRNGRADYQRDRRMIDISGGNERDRACVIDAVRIRVDLLVELR